VVDYSRYKQIIEPRDTPSKHRKVLAEEHVALNETSIEELCKLFIFTKKLVDAILFNFNGLQTQWMK
jgi:hypothetical protein